ncbi:MAG TPA: hypothetical protein V6D11_02070 [Waterburya sp.]
MTYWTSITPITDSLRLVDLKGNEISKENQELCRSFEQHLIDLYKEGNLVFVYRGESLKGLRKKLFSDEQDFSESKLYERLFIFGDKARHFFMHQTKDSSREGLTTINDISDETFGFLFERIVNVLSHPNLGPKVQQSCSRRFVSYFFDNRNRQNFIDLVNSATKDIDKDKLQLRDYYLYFLHVAGTPGVRKETMLVSTSLSLEISERFSGNNNKDSLILYGFILQPYHNFIVSPWLASEYHQLASRNGLPTYQPFGLFPEQLEVSVKGALFPGFILGVKQVENSHFVVNPHVFKIKNFEDVGKYGIPFQKDDFMSSILSTNYSSFVSTDLQGNFEEHERS